MHKTVAEELIPAHVQQFARELSALKHDIGRHMDALLAADEARVKAEKERNDARATYGKVLQSWAESRQRHLKAEAELAAIRASEETSDV